MQSLIEHAGGPNVTEARLDTMFIPGLRTVDVGGNNGAGTTLYNSGQFHTLPPLSN
jgi:hypothetical protein